MLPPLATVEDLIDRLGGPVDSVPRAESLLRYASALVRAAAGGRTFVDDHGEIDAPDGIPEVTISAVERAVLSTPGISQETAGPFSISATPDPYLTKGDRSIIRSAVGQGRAFTIDTTPASSALHPLAGATVNGPHGAPGEP